MEIAIVFGFGCQLALLAFFAAHRWWPAHEWALGRLVYGLGIPAALLAVVLVIVGPALAVGAGARAVRGVGGPGSLARPHPSDPVA